VGVVGVLSIQGDFEKHLRSLALAGVPKGDCREVRTVEDLEGVERLILPGGESTTVGLLLERYGLGEAIRARARNGMPIWGTCMGMILLARGVEGRQQYTLGLMDMVIRRNAFGAQVNSFEAPVEVDGLDEPILGVFIRAPIVLSYGQGVLPLAHLDGHCVAVRQGNLLGTSFHPELTDDVRLHQWFLSW
jgi:5'-phosphate synthase pdxT subunit